MNKTSDEDEDEGHTKEARDIPHLNLQFLFLRKIEKGFALSNDILYQAVLDTYVLNIEETDSEKSIAK